MVHGILQFTPSIAFRYVLHRCKSLDIRCRESFYIMCQNTTHTKTVSGAVRVRPEQNLNSLTHQRRGLSLGGEEKALSAAPPKQRSAEAYRICSNLFACWSACKASTMSLPQVHLRKDHCR